ncbi:pseudouridine synthase, partial [Halieaceae bacterium]|nr:pseudouridine synthase [Halieaceae bacterium]
ELKDGLTKPAQVKTIEPPTQLWPRVPAIRQRKDQPTSWIELAISEGKNRQIRRMTAAVGYPALRLIRHSIGNWSLGDLQPGQYSQDIVHTMQGDERNRKTFKLTKTK